DRPVDQAAVENCLLAGTAFTADEATGDLAGGVELLFVVTGEREKVDPFPRRRRHHRGDEQHGVAHPDGDSTGCLLGDLPCFNLQGPSADFELCLVHDSSWAALGGRNTNLAIGPGGSSLAG